MINFDTIGRGKIDEIYLIGALRSPDLFVFANSIAKSLGLTINKNIEFAFPYGSGHYFFYLKSIPSIDFCSGLSEDYHTIRDLPSKINYDKLIKWLKFNIYFVKFLSNQAPTLVKPKKVFVPYPKFRHNSQRK